MKNLEVPLAAGACAYKVQDTWVIPENRREISELTTLWERKALGSATEISGKSWVKFTDESAASAVAEELNDPTTA